jgi:hypothetical protein
MTDPKPIFTTDAELDTVIQPDNPLVLVSGGFKLEFDLEQYNDDGALKDGDNEGLRLKLTYAFPDNGGFFELHETFGDGDTEALYRLARVAVLNQLRQEDSEYADSMRMALKEAELPKVGRLKDTEFPKPFTEPLVLEKTANRKVLDWRNMGKYGGRATSERDHPWDSTTKYASGDPDWVYVAGVKVHLATCPKMNKQVGTRDGINGRRAVWLDVTTVVRQGVLVPEMCATCQPLGQYSKFVTNQVTYLNNPMPDTMPTKYVEYGELTAANRQWLWNHLSAMDGKDWAALADFIEWAAAEVDDTPSAEAPAV